MFATCFTPGFTYSGHLSPAPKPFRIELLLPLLPNSEPHTTRPTFGYAACDQRILSSAGLGFIRQFCPKLGNLDQILQIFMLCTGLSRIRDTHIGDRDNGRSTSPVRRLGDTFRFSHDRRQSFPRSGSTERSHSQVNTGFRDRQPHRRHVFRRTNEAIPLRLRDLGYSHEHPRVREHRLSQEASGDTVGFGLPCSGGLPFERAKD